MTTLDSIQVAAMYAQAHLDEALPLERLADVVGLSSHHFQREFSRQTGESPAQFVERLRLEKAAFRLLVEDRSILNIALDCGYANHETMSRAFKRRFQVSPRQFRKRGEFPLKTRSQSLKPAALDSGWRISTTRLTRLNPVRIAFIRSNGPYEGVNPGLWERLLQWSREKNYAGERILMGIGHDAPGITPDEKLRFDACISVPDKAAPEGEIRTGALSSLLCAVTTHVGPYGSLTAAYPKIFEQTAAIKSAAVIGLPVIEIYRDDAVHIFRDVSITDIYLPMKDTSEEEG